MIVVLGKEYAGLVVDVLEYLNQGKKVLEIFYDENKNNYVGKYITLDNYDQMVAESYVDRVGSWLEVELICDVITFENGSIVDVPKGDYYINFIEEIVQ